MANNNNNMHLINFIQFLMQNPMVSNNIQFSEAGLNIWGGNNPTFRITQYKKSLVAQESANIFSA